MLQAHDWPLSLFSGLGRHIDFAKAALVEMNLPTMIFASALHSPRKASYPGSPRGGLRRATKTPPALLGRQSGQAQEINGGMAMMGT